MWYIFLITIGITFGTANLYQYMLKLKSKQPVEYVFVNLIVGIVCLVGGIAFAVFYFTSY
jgi:hypothetical protein